MHKNASILDVISVSAQRDSIVIMPSLPHAIHWWPRLIKAAKLQHGAYYVNNTKTAIIFHDTHTIIRLWVPYAREPTQPMDYAPDRSGKEMLNLYGMYRGGLV